MERSSGAQVLPGAAATAPTLRNLMQKPPKSAAERSKTTATNHSPERMFKLETHYLDVRGTNVLAHQQSMDHITQKRMENPARAWS